MYTDSFSGISASTGPNLSLLMRLSHYTHLLLRLVLDSRLVFSKVYGDVHGLRGRMRAGE